MVIFPFLLCGYFGGHDLFEELYDFDSGAFFISVDRAILLHEGEFLKIRNLNYVKVARTMGMPSMHILFRQILPNGLTP